MKEIAYTIDPIQSEQSKTLTIKIVEAEREGYYLNFSDKIRPLFRQDLEKIATAQDKLVLPYLIDEEFKFQKKTMNKSPNPTTTPLNHIHTPYAQSLQTLKLLAATGKLYFNGRQLAVDFYGKTTFSYVVSQAFEVAGVFHAGKEEFPLDACDFICQGPPHWLIKGISLKILSTDIAFKDLKKVYKSQAIFKAAEIKELEEAHTENNEEPALIYLGRAQNAIKTQMEALPLLMLKDRSGAFADLWLDYGDGDRKAWHSLSQPSAAEKAWEKDLLETDFIRKLMATSHYYCAMDKVAKSLTFLLEIGWELIDWKGNRIVRLSDASISLHSHDQFIQAKGTLTYDDHKVELTKVLGAFNRRERFVEIAPDTVGLIPSTWEFVGISSLVEEGEIMGNTVRLKKHAFGAIADILESKKISLDHSLTQLQEKFANFSGIQNVLPSPNFNGTLRGYQQTGVNWLAFLYDFGFHGILADDMGLGKTVQVLAFISQLTILAPILIVLPTSLLFNWKHEIAQFLPGMPVVVHHGPGRPKSVQDIPHIILTSYTTLRNDLPMLSQIGYECVILDEAQMIKNPQTQIAQAVCSLQAHFRLCITGTPIENHLGELWSHFRFLMPDLLGDQAAFAADLQAANSDSRYFQKIKKKIKPFILRRRKEEVAKDLPERIEQVVWIEMPPAQRQIYDEYLSGIKNNLIKKVDLEGMGKHRMEVLEAILRLRQICCHPLLVSSVLSEEALPESGKLESLLQDIETAIEEGRKVLVYSQFTSMLHLIAKEMKQREWRYVYLDGNTIDRQKVVAEFQNDPAIPVFLISLKAGGVGLNLTAADYVFLYDPWWNEAVENQAIDRAHRIGRKDTVIAKRYVMVETIEEKILTLKAKKRSLITDVLDDEMGSLNLGEDDFRFLVT